MLFSEILVVEVAYRGYWVLLLSVKKILLNLKLGLSPRSCSTLFVTFVFITKLQ